MLAALILWVLIDSAQATPSYDKSKSICIEKNTQKPALIPHSLGICGDFTSENLLNYHPENIYSDGADYSFSRWHGVTAKSWTGENFKMIQTMINESKLSQLRFLKVDMRGAVFSKVKIDNFDIQSSNLSGVKIQKSRFIGGRMSNVILKDMVLTDVVFEDSILPERIKSEALMINVKFERCRFEK